MEYKESTKIKGLKILSPYIFHDFRGEYVETFRIDQYQFKDDQGNLISFVEDDISVSKYGTLRGLHGDSKTWKLIQCLWGEIYVAVVDMRIDSPTYLNYETFAVNDKNRLQILVPAGCGNGHLCLSERCIFSYKQSELYSGMQNQFTIKWDEPKFNIFWPIKEPIQSSRDSSAEYIK